MGEQVSHSEGVLAQSREKAQLYLNDGRQFALSHAIDLKLGLGPEGFELAVSHCASQLLKDDITSSTVLNNKVPNFRFLSPLKSMTAGNLRELELAEDYLSRKRDEMIGEHFPDNSGEFPLAIRQAVQGLFAIERSREAFQDKDYQQEVETWGAHWRTRISQQR